MTRARRALPGPAGAKGDTGAQGHSGQALVHYALTPLPHPHFHDANVREVKGSGGHVGRSDTHDGHHAA